jgi:phosphoribosylformimino-5-aminoimidazole carboxamide ribotide isomerase
MSFEIYPAIDVRGARVVRLAQGDYARETCYSSDPLEVAMAYAAAGARWLHLVDLDAAREGGYTLAPLLARIKAETSLRVQTGGGVRSGNDVQRLLDEGADRVVIGSLAVSDRRRVAGWMERLGAERIAVALDARCAPDGRWWPASHGWTRPAEATLDELVHFHAQAGLRHLLCTDIARDGMLGGPNLELYGLVGAWAPGLLVQASGGVRDAADVAAARSTGCGGVVLGKALLDGRVTLPQVMAC